MLLVGQRLAVVEGEPDGVLQLEAAEQRLEGRRTDEGAGDDGGALLVGQPITVARGDAWGVGFGIAIVVIRRDHDTLFARWRQLEVPQQHILLIVQERNQVATVTGDATGDAAGQRELAGHTGWDAL